MCISFLHIEISYLSKTQITFSTEDKKDRLNKFFVKIIRIIKYNRIMGTLLYSFKESKRAGTRGVELLQYGSTKIRIVSMMIEAPPRFLSFKEGFSSKHCSCLESMREISISKAYNYLLLRPLFRSELLRLLSSFSLKFLRLRRKINSLAFDNCW